MFVEEKRHGEAQTVTLKDVVNLLRNPQNWPKDFHWDYCCPQFCAIGLAQRLRANIYDLVSERKQDRLAAIILRGNRNWRLKRCTAPDQIAKSLEKLC